LTSYESNSVKIGFSDLVLRHEQKLASQTKKTKNHSRVIFQFNLAWWSESTKAPLTNFSLSIQPVRGGKKLKIASMLPETISRNWYKMEAQE